MLPKKIAKVQSTLTNYFGASSRPEIKHPTALVRQGMHVYEEREIAEARGIQKKRRIFWNEECDGICKNEKYRVYKKKVIELWSALVRSLYNLQKSFFHSRKDQAFSFRMSPFLCNLKKD